MQPTINLRKLTSNTHIHSGEYHVCFIISFNNIAISANIQNIPHDSVADSEHLNRSKERGGWGRRNILEIIKYCSNYLHTVSGMEISFFSSHPIDT